MIEHVLDNVACIPGIHRICIVTNGKFIDLFEAWSRSMAPDCPTWNSS